MSAGRGTPTRPPRHFAAGALAVLALAAAASGAKAGAVIKGGTLVITPGAAVQADIDHIRVLAAPPGIAVTCGGATYVLSTGSTGATCRAKTDSAGAVEWARCADDAGNVAAARCGGDSGPGACEETAGAGLCRAE
ncbi:MAG: hypothetical protein IRY94_15130 [Rhodospirillaceae bacterium]|nr:hypothetical protein [Rhodospirillaceae bacterium]